MSNLVWHLGDFFSSTPRCQSRCFGPIFAKELLKNWFREKRLLWVYFSFNHTAQCIMFMIMHFFKSWFHGIFVKKFRQIIKIPKVWLFTNIHVSDMLSRTSWYQNFYWNTLYFHEIFIFLIDSYDFTKVSLGENHLPIYFLIR